MRRDGNGRKVYMKLSTALKNVDVLRLRERCGGMGIVHLKNAMLEE